MESVAFIAMAAVAYLVGSIPTGFLVARTQGIDIRKAGSGNIGATNVLRNLGVAPGLLVLVIDGFKGFAACAWLADAILHWVAPPQTDPLAMRIVAGFGAIAGHNYTCWLGFRGGKGIATSAGVLAVLVPWSLLAIALVWVVVLGLSRYVSLASIAASASLPLATWVSGRGLALCLATAGMAVLAIYKHHENIRRLWHGTEHRLGSKTTQAPTSSG